METPITKQEILSLIHKHLTIAPEDTLEKALELLEDEQDIRDARVELEDIKINGGIPWEEIKKDTRKDVA